MSGRFPIVRMLIWLCRRRWRRTKESEEIKRDPDPLEFRRLGEQEVGEIGAELQYFCFILKAKRATSRYRSVCRGSI